MARVTKITDSAVTPEEVSRIKRSIEGREQAPTSRELSEFTDWRQAREQLGNPFEVDVIPLSKLRLMRRDPMLAFGLFFIKVPHMRAKWYAEATSPDGPNAQISAHLDHDLRLIYSSFVSQWANALDFGYQALVKRFEYRTPTATYVDVNPDSGEETIQPVWSEGSVKPVAFKTFTALRPEFVMPRWNGKGEFDGIEYTVTGETGAEPAKDIDLYHSLWVTHNRDENWGSLFGYSRLGVAYRYWWSYWFRWAIADRAFERRGDPSILVYHPPGSYETDTGEVINFSDLALSMGERVRSGGVFALPSEMYEDINGPTNAPKWRIDIPTQSLDFTPFDKSFDYLDVQKLRCVTGDTPIECPRDYDKYPKGIPISEIKPGQLIWGFNEGTRLFELQRAKVAAKTGENRQVFRVHLSNGEQIRATDNHPFLTTDLKWVPLQDLKVSDRLVGFHAQTERFVQVDPTRNRLVRHENKEYLHVADYAYDGIPEGVEVHHKSGSHSDSSEENLELLSVAEHRALRHNRLDSRSRAAIGKANSKYKAKEVIAKLHAEDDERLVSQEIITEKALASGSERRVRMIQLADEGLSQRAVADKLGVSQRTVGNVLRGATKTTAALKLLDTRICVNPQCAREFLPASASQTYCRACRWSGQRASALRSEEMRKTRTETPSWKELVKSVAIISIEPDGYEDVWDISIDTDNDDCRNFVSNGVVLHNSLSIPEQAFLEGRGGTSSRNVAHELGESFIESQAVLSAQITETINRWIIPQWLALNYPEFVVQGGSAKIVVQGFADQDLDFTKQIIQLIGQQEGGQQEILKLVDLKRVLQDAGTPIASFDEQKRRETEIQSAQQATQPAPGQLGVIPTPGTATGFSYAISPERIELAAPVADFLEQLPATVHYEDKEVRSIARQLWLLYYDFYKDEYNSAANYLDQSKVELSDPLDKLKAWTGSSKFQQVAEKAKELFNKLVSHAARKESRRAQLDDKLTDAQKESYVQDFLAQLSGQITDTTRNELINFAERRLNEGILAPLPDDLRDHFAGYPEWKASRLVRTSVRDAYNTATIMAAEAAGVDKVQALDAQLGPTDHDCEDRDGNIYSVSTALKETEHPNGTLGWRIVPQFTTVYDVALEFGAEFDEETKILTLNRDLDSASKRKIFKSVVDTLTEA